MILRYSDMLRDPASTVRDVHTHLRLRTSRPLLDAFVREHFGAEHARESASSPYGTVRAHRPCRRQASMPGVVPCAALLQLVEPLHDC